jgi:hypothetical protein
MPDSATISRARADARAGKSASTQAGEFVREEFHHIREGKHGARSSKQAIAIGLSKARRAGVKLGTPAPGRASAKVRRQAERDTERGQSNGHRHTSPLRSRAVLGALKREGHQSASHAAISRQATSAAHRRSATERSAAAGRAASTKGSVGRSDAARKAAQSRTKRD